MFKDPVFISLYLLVFAFFWILICGMLSWSTGWYKFRKKHPFNPTHDPIEQFNFSSIQFNQTGSYTYSILVSIYKEGIGIQPLLLYRAFHKPYLIRWEEISDIKDEKEFFWYKVLDVYVEGTKIRFYGKMVESIKRQYDTRYQAG
jgi:hypothetical protein